MKQKLENEVPPHSLEWLKLRVLFAVVLVTKSCLTLWPHGQAPLSMVFPRQEYCSGLSFPSPGDLPNPGIKPESLVSPELAGGLFTTSVTWENLVRITWVYRWKAPSRVLSTECCRSVCWRSWSSLNSTPVSQAFCWTLGIKRWTSQSLPFREHLT